MLFKQRQSQYKGKSWILAILVPVDSNMKAIIVPLLAISATPDNILCLRKDGKRRNGGQMYCFLTLKQGNECIYCH